MILPARASSDFKLNLEPSMLEIAQGSKSNTTINLVSQGTFNDTIELSMTGQNWTFNTQLSTNNSPLSMNRTFLRIYSSENVTLTITVPSFSPLGCCHILNVTGTAPSNGTSHSTVLNVTVTQSNSTGNQLVTVLVLVGAGGLLFLITALTVIFVKRSRRIVRHPYVP